MKQMPLFGEPSKPFALTPSPVLIVLCPRCSRQIVVSQRNTKGEIVSEYQGGKAGLCWSCSFEK